MNAAAIQDNGECVLKDASNKNDQDPDQRIALQGNDSSNTYSVYGQVVEIAPSKTSSQAHVNASNKIKVNKIVNYEWEQRYNYGSLIAIHKSGQYFAYSIRVENSGKVRVFHKKLNEKVLLKSFKGRVVDLSFAHYDLDVLLGCVDETGCLQIFKIFLDADSKLQTAAVLNIAPFNAPKISANSSLSGGGGNSDELGSGGASTPTQQQQQSRASSDNVHRIIWCTYIPDPSTVDLQGETMSLADDASKVFLLSNRNRAEIFHLDMIQQNQGGDCENRQISASELTIGHLAIEEHKSNILTASFSPDGSAIATASANGEVNFYKITFSNSNYESTSDNDVGGGGNQDTPTPPTPKCLQKWMPHESRPVTSLYFLDDHKNPSPDAQFWSFILTGCDFNREIKIWSCSKWECLQTIRFAPGESSALQPCLKTSIDLSSNYLVMSDIARKCFYVLHLLADVEKNVARCTAVSEFILAYPALSFALIDSFKIKAKKYNQLANVNTGTAGAAMAGAGTSLDDIEIGGGGGGASSIEHQSSLGSNQSESGATAADNDLVTLIKLYCIQTKQLQEMQIFLTGEQSINAYNNNSSSSPPPLSQPLTPYSSSSSGGGNPHNSSSSSILQQILPNAGGGGGGSPMIRQQQQQAQRGQKTPGMNTSLSMMSFSSDLKDRLSDVNTSDFESDNKSLTASAKLVPPSSLAASSSQKAKSGASSSEAVNKSIEDSSIVQIVTPQQIGVNVNPTPVLMTPDAFINSPNNQLGRRSMEPATVSSAATANKGDLLQSLMSSTNSNNNLLSSRTSSLTQVTQVSVAGAGGATLIPVTSSSNNKSNKKDSHPHHHRQQRSRNLSSSSSSSSTSSTTSSTTTTTSSSECSSILDSADKEIAALSAANSRNNSSIGGGAGLVVTSANSQSNNSKSKSNSKRSSLLDQDKSGNQSANVLLSQVSIENDDCSYVSGETVVVKGPNHNHQHQHQNSTESNDEQGAAADDGDEFKLTSKPFGIQSWPLNPPDVNASVDESSALIDERVILGGAVAAAAGGDNSADFKSLLVQMTHAIRSQHEEIENLKKHQINSQTQLKSQIDITLKQFLSNQQQQYQRQLSTQQQQFQLQQVASANGSASAAAASFVNDEKQMSLLIQQTLLNSVVPKIDKSIRDEVNRSFNSVMAARLMDPVREQLSREIAEKMKAVESVLKESVSKMFKSKSLMDSMSQSVVTSMQGVIINSYRETFQKVIVPNFEKACQAMYQQVNATFAKGTQEYIHEFEQNARLQRKQIEENKEPILQQMKQFNEQMQASSAQMTAELSANIQQQFDALLRNTNAVLQDTIISSVKAIIKEEIQVAMRDQQHTLPDRLIAQMRQSGTMTPINVLGGPMGAGGFLMQGGGGGGTGAGAQASTQDIQHQITTLLKSGQINNAFQVALCAADLNLLMHLCECVSPTQVFEQMPSTNPKQKPQCQLTQPVILSLVQQLSQELHLHTDLKVKYLEEALVSLDLQNALTREHTPAVIGQLVQKLQQFIQTHPNEKAIKSFRMLLMASQSLLSAPKTASKP